MTGIDLDGEARFLDRREMSADLAETAQGLEHRRALQDAERLVIRATWSSTGLKSFVS